VPPPTCRLRAAGLVLHCAGEGAQRVSVQAETPGAPEGVQPESALELDLSIADSFSLRLVFERKETPVDPDALSDSDFLAGFNACSLSPTAFNHRGHLRIAWIHLQMYTPDEAVERICRGIERFAAHLGVPGKYNESLTVALVRLMAAGGGADRALSFEDFLSANAELVAGAKGLLARHYSPARLESPEARQSFVPPDRAPLPA
jgi:hypothetical protein